MRACHLANVCFVPNADAHIHIKNPAQGPGLRLLVVENVLLGDLI